jgi:hypothetical protein
MSQFTPDNGFPFAPLPSQLKRELQEFRESWQEQSVILEKPSRGDGIRKTYDLSPSRFAAWRFNWSKGAAK